MPEIIAALLGLGGGIAIAATIGLIIFLNPEKFEKWIAMLLNLIGFIGVGVRKEHTKRNIQSGLNSYAKKLAKDTGIEPVGMKVKWHGREDEDEIKWKDGDVVLVLRDRGQRQRNFVHAAYLFTSTTLLKDIKKYLSQKQTTALDLYTTGKVIEAEDRGALGVFNKDIFNPLLDDTKVKEMVTQFEDIDTAGYYYNVLLQELEHLSEIVILNNRKSEVQEEVRSLIKFLNDFALREQGDDTVQDEFVGKFLRCSIKIVSTAPVREAGKTSGPATRICRAFEKGIENVYVIGPGHIDGQAFIDKVCENVIVKNNDVEVITSKNFKGIVTSLGRSKTTDTHMVQLQSSAQRRLIAPKDSYEAIKEYEDELLSASAVDDGNAAQTTDESGKTI